MDLKKLYLLIGLAVVIVGNDPASQVYVRNKARACEAIGMHSEVHALPATVTQAELVTASLKADDSLRAAVAEAGGNIAAFARKSQRKDWQTRNSHGAAVGEKFDPFRRVGIYIPGGTAPLVSTALMTVTLAKVAGCPEIVVCTPCGKDGSINPAILFAARAPSSPGRAAPIPALRLELCLLRVCVDEPVDTPIRFAYIR